jgi:hypothetical protein
VETLRPDAAGPEIDVVIGARGPIAPPEMCNGLMLPIIAFDQIYTFDRDALIKAIPRPEEIPAARFTAAATELFDRIMQMTDNAGATDKHRALNYAALKHDGIYMTTAQAFAREASLSAVDVRTSPLSGARKVVDLIFSYTNRKTDVVEKFAARIDVTEEFPFLLSKMTPYFDH